MKQEEQKQVSSLISQYPEGYFNEFEEWAQRFVVKYNVIQASVPVLMEAFISHKKHMYAVNERILKAIDKMPEPELNISKMNKHVKPSWMP